MARIKTHLNIQQINLATQRFVPNEFIQSLGKSSLTEVKLGDLVEKEVSVLFSDIRDYTSLSEAMTPEENFKFVSSYMRRMGPVIQDHHGFVNQYLGDGIMAIFQRSPDDGLKAAIGMQQVMTEYNEQRRAENRREIKIGIGLHTGSLIMGIIGDKRRADAATISDTVNSASRMEGLTKGFGSKILISEVTLQKLAHPEEFKLRYLGKVKVKGKKNMIGLYECFDADDSELLAHKLATSTQMEEGVGYLEKKDYPLAIKVFDTLVKAHPDDRAAQFLLRQSVASLSSDTEG